MKNLSFPFLARVAAALMTGNATVSEGVAPTNGDELSPWGVSSSASGMSNIGEWMPRLHEAGLTSARLFPEWRSLEPKQGQWNWTRTDSLVQTADRNSIRITALLMGSVPWNNEKGHTFPMSDLNAWSNFVAQSVARYKERIHHWEIWNEGNGGFNDGHHTAIDYAKLTATAYAAAKKSDPEAQIGLTTASFDPAYLHQTILAQKQAGTPSFDYLCIHPYEIADGIGHPDGEVPYLWMTALLRDTLKQSVPEKADADIWITEVGRNIAKRKSQPEAEREAAAVLVKLYIMAIAQGIRCVQWFEAQDPAREEPGFGLLKRDGTPRASCEALKAMTSILGPTPKYLGWIAPGKDQHAFGFVFQGPGGPVLAAWKAAGQKEESIRFTQDSKTKSIAGTTTITLPAGKPLALLDEPVFVTDLPESLVKEGIANKAKKFPWGGDFSKAKTVSTQWNNEATPGGIFQTGSRTNPKITFPDGSSGILVSANQGTQFYLHPSFASIHTRQYFVRITVRRITPGNVGMNLFYEIADTQGRTPYRNKGQWFGVGADDGWQTYTWQLSDACFAKMWGYDISFRPEQSQPFVLGKVEVSTERF
jgi:hypothetical protein